jgi:uncharacterized protein YndB with AHSA1/START domain
VNAPRSTVYKRMLRPDVMQRYLFADDVEAIAGARGEDLGAEFHCHHGGSLVNMRVVSIEPDHELTLISDQPTTLHVTTRMTDAPNNRTRVARSFLWETPADPDVASGLHQMMEGIVAAGEGAIKEVFEGT